MKKSREYITAIHEAGHATAHLYYGIKFKNLSIIPEGISGGRLNVLPKKKLENLEIVLGCLSAKQERTIRHECISLMAGPVAAAKYLKLKKILNASSRGDESMLFDYSEHLEVPRAGYLHFLNLNIELAKKLFQDEKNPEPKLWRFTKLLADHLFKQKELSYRFCLQLYKKECIINWHDSNNPKDLNNTPNWGERKVTEIQYRPYTERY